MKGGKEGGKEGQKKEGKKGREIDDLKMREILY